MKVQNKLIIINTKYIENGGCGGVGGCGGGKMKSRKYLSGDTLNIEN